MLSASVNAEIDDYTLDPAATFIRFTNTSAGSIDLTGISNAGIRDGRMITLANLGAQGIVIKHNNSQSLVGNRIDLPGASDIILGPKGVATFIYDVTTQHWELVSTN
jgi:hypothetical protein